MALKYPMKPISNSKDSPWLDWIISGDKKYEGRLNRGFWAQVSIDDSFYLVNDNLIVFVKVIDKLHYANFSNAFDQLGSELVPINNISNEQVRQIYNDIYSSDEIEQYGVVAIKLKVLLNSNTDNNQKSNSNDIFIKI